MSERFHDAHAEASRPARAVSLALVVLVAAVAAWHPSAIADGAAIPDRIALALALTGAVGGMAHAVGHTAERRFVRRLAMPLLAWPLMITGTLWLVATGWVTRF